MPGTVKLRSWKRVRQGCYRLARCQGNVQPWLELGMLDPKAPRKIVRRFIHRKIGRVFSKQLFGSGLIAKTIKAILGL